MSDAVRLADHWLDETTGFPSGVTTAAAWSRAEWVVNTTEVWKVLVEPVAQQSVGAMGSALPESAQAQAAPILGILGKAIGALLANQVGSGLGTLAGEVLSVSDIGIPLTTPGRAALVTTNVTEFAEGLDVSEDDVLLYLALREAAHQRLFAGVPWLRDHVIGDGHRLRPGHRGQRRGHPAARRGADARHRPDQPGVDAAAARQRDVRAARLPRPEGRAGAARGRARARRGLGRRGRRPGDRRADAQRHQAAGGLPPPPGRGRAGRADLRDAGRARAPAAPAPGRVDAVGLAAHPAGRRGPRRRVDAPRPAADRRRPRRPARLPRGRQRAGAAQRRGVRRGPAGAARRRGGRPDRGRVSPARLTASRTAQTPSSTTVASSLAGSPHSLPGGGSIRAAADQPSR